MTESIELTVTGMKCGGCEANVTKIVKALSGVENVTANHNANKVSVEFNADALDEATIKQAIAQAGYGVD